MSVITEQSEIKVKKSRLKLNVGNRELDTSASYTKKELDINGWIKTRETCFQTVHNSQVTSHVFFFFKELKMKER